jgi:hypothetical protein
MKGLIYVKGSTIKLKAVGGSNTEVELECVNKDFDIDWGSKASEKSVCHNIGSYYERSKGLEFAEQTISLRGLPSDKNDTVVKFLLDSLYETAGTDFDETVAGNSIEYTMTIEFTDPNANKIEVQGFTTYVKTPVIIEKALNLEFGFQPTQAPVRS